MKHASCLFFKREQWSPVLALQKTEREGGAVWAINIGILQVLAIHPFRS
jgi:hypothetical protein